MKNKVKLPHCCVDCSYYEDKGNKEWKEVNGYCRLCKMPIFGCDSPNKLRCGYCPFEDKEIFKWTTEKLENGSTAEFVEINLVRKGYEKVFDRAVSDPINIESVSNEQLKAAYKSLEKDYYFVLDELVKLDSRNGKLERIVKQIEEQL